jgi:hypothetical protein
MTNHTNFYVGFFALMEQTDKQYGINQEPETLDENEELENAWYALQRVPSYVEVQAALFVAEGVSA